MIQYLYSTSKKPTISTSDTLKAGAWVRSERPNDEDKAILIELGIDESILHDALDPHEVPRVELEDGWTYFITRLPDTDDDFNDFTTPILFAISHDNLVTVSRDSLGSPMAAVYRHNPYWYRREHRAAYLHDGSSFTAIPATSGNDQSPDASCN